VDGCAQGFCIVVPMDITALILAFRGGGWGMGILGAIALIFGFILIGGYTMVGIGLTFGPGYNF